MSKKGDVYYLSKKDKSHYLNNEEERKDKESETSSSSSIVSGYANEKEEKIGYENENNKFVEYGNIVEEEVSDDLHKSENVSTDLIEKKNLIGSDGVEYILEPWLNEKIAKKIEKENGIFLKKGEGRNEGKFNSLLGGGAFGKFYVGFKKSKNNNKTEEIIGIKVISKKLEENEIEATIQRDLTIGIEKLGFESRLMPIFDIIKEKDEKSGKLIGLNLIMPLASFGNVDSLREKLKLEKDKELKRLVSKLICKDLLIGIWQMHIQDYYHLDIKLENMVVSSQGLKKKINSKKKQH
jgi:hypothetical protein